MSRRRPGIQFVVGLSIVLLSLYWFSQAYGEGPTFPPVQLYLWPMAAVGGVTAGYGLAGLFEVGSDRLRRVGIAVTLGALALSVSFLIQEVESPVREVTVSDLQILLLGVAISLPFVLIVEIWLSVFQGAPAAFE